jgi:GT2 family glycosyltransferase
MAVELDLTIIIPSFNTKNLLRNCIKSIYAHTVGISFEIICFDDNSPDGSADMISAEFPEVILIRNKVNRFYAKNNNDGMRMSRGRYACLLNSDTVLIGNAFKSLVEYMDTNPNVAACGPKLLNPDMSVQHCIRRFVGPWVLFLQALNWHKLFPNSKVVNRYYVIDFDYSQAQPVESIGTTAYFVRRSTWENAGMLDERFRLAVVDLAYNLMLMNKGYIVHYTPCAEVVHFGGQSINQHTLNSLRDQYEALCTINQEYDYFSRNYFIKRVVGAALWLRYQFKKAEYYLSSDKRLIKGPGAPRFPEYTKEQFGVGGQSSADL